MADIDIQVELAAAPQITVELLPALEMPVTIAGDVILDVDVSAVGPQGPQGATGASGGTVWSIGVPAEAPNGSRTVFTTPSAYVASGLMVYLNGLRETNVSETTATTFTFSTAPITGDIISLFYRTS